MPKFDTGCGIDIFCTVAFMYYIIAHKRKIIKRKVKKEGRENRPSFLMRCGCVFIRSYRFTVPLGRM